MGQIQNARSAVVESHQLSGVRSAVAVKVYGDDSRPDLDVARIGGPVAKPHAAGLGGSVAVVPYFRCARAKNARGGASAGLGRRHPRRLLRAPRQFPPEPSRSALHPILCKN